MNAHPSAIPGESHHQQFHDVEPDPGLSDRFLTKLYGNTEGWACFAYKPVEVGGGRNESIKQHWFRWPDEEDHAIAWIEDTAPHHALYWAPLLRETDDRTNLDLSYGRTVIFI